MDDEHCVWALPYRKLHRVMVETEEARVFRENGAINNEGFDLDEMHWEERGEIGDRLEYLKEENHWDEMNLDYNDISVASAQLICDALCKSGPMLKTLSLKDVCSTRTPSEKSEILSLIISTAAQRESLDSIDLSGTSLSGMTLAEAMNVFDAVFDSPNLTQVTIDECGIEGDVAEGFWYSIGNGITTNLLSLSMRDNNFYGTGIICGGPLATCKALRFLDFRGCRLGVVGGLELGFALASLSDLKMVDLSNTILQETVGEVKIGLEAMGADFVGSVGVKHQAVTEATKTINLTKIITLGIDAIAKALGHCKQLLAVRLEKTLVGAFGPDLVDNLTCRCVMLPIKTLDLTSSGIGPKTLERLVTQSKYLSSLRVLKVGGNGFDCLSVLFKQLEQSIRPPSVQFGTEDFILQTLSSTNNISIFSTSLPPPTAYPVHTKHLRLDLPSLPDRYYLNALVHETFVQDLDRSGNTQGLLPANYDADQHCAWCGASQDGYLEIMHLYFARRDAEWAKSKPVLDFLKKNVYSDNATLYLIAEGVGLLDNYLVGNDYRRHPSAKMGYASVAQVFRTYTRTLERFLSPLAFKQYLDTIFTPAVLPILDAIGTFRNRKGDIDVEAFKKHAEELKSKKALAELTAKAAKEKAAERHNGNAEGKERKEEAGKSSKRAKRGHLDDD